MSKIFHQLFKVGIGLVKRKWVLTVQTHGMSLFISDKQITYCSLPEDCLARNGFSIEGFFFMFLQVLWFCCPFIQVFLLPTDELPTVL